MDVQQLFVGMRESDLTNSRGRLTFLQFELAGAQREVTPPQRDGARGDQNHFLPALAAGSHIRRQALEPSAIEAALVAIYQQARADFDDDTPRIGQAARGEFAVFNGHKSTILPFT